MKTQMCPIQSPDQKANRGRQSIERKTQFEQSFPSGEITTTETLPVTSDSEETLTTFAISDVVPLRHEQLPNAPEGKTVVHPLQQDPSHKAADMPEKTMVMPTDDIEMPHLSTAVENTNEVDRTVIMPTDELTKALSKPSDDKIDPEKTMAMDGAIAKKLQQTQHQKMTLKKSLTATFRTGTFQIFDKQEDVDQVIHNQKSLPAKTALHKETETPDAMDSVSTNFEIGKEFAAGGQGILSIGTDRHLKRPVAIKSLRKE